MHNCPHQIKANGKSITLYLLSADHLRKEALTLTTDYYKDVTKNHSDPYHRTSKILNDLAHTNPAELLEQAGVIKTYKKPEEPNVVNRLKTGVEKLLGIGKTTPPFTPPT